MLMVKKLNIENLEQITNFLANSLMIQLTLWVLTFMIFVWRYIIDEKKGLIRNFRHFISSLTNARFR